MIGIISAMEPEMRALAASLDGRKTETHSALSYNRGKLGGVECVVCECGVGKVNAASHAQILIDRYAPDAIIFTGVAGALSPEVGLFDTVVATELVYHDMSDFVLDTFSPLERVYRTDERLTSLALDACEAIGTPHIAGRVATGDVFVSDQATKNDIFAHTHALCTEMEGCAVAHVAYLAGVPCAVLRAISDNADGGAEVDFPAFLERAAKTSAAVVRELLARM